MGQDRPRAGNGVSPALRMWCARSMRLLPALRLASPLTRGGIGECVARRGWRRPASNARAGRSGAALTTGLAARPNRPRSLSPRSLRLARMAALRHVALRSLANAPMFQLSGAPGARLFRFRVAEIFVTTSPADTVRLDHAAIRRILIGLMLAMFLSALDQTIVATALADHRARLCGRRKPHLGGHRLSAGRDRRHAALRQALRHLRPPARAARRHRDLRRRLDRLRARAHHAGADRGARAAGPRRRRADRAVADHRRRRRLARASAGAIRAISARCSRSPRSPARCSAACSPSICTGRSSSGSTCRSACGARHHRPRAARRCRATSARTISIFSAPP